MKFTAVGDALIQRRIPADYSGYEELRPIIEKGDARFFNLETTLNDEGECFASQFSGGTYLRATPAVLGDMQAFGFNMTNCNNNHIMDFSYEGLLRTLETLDKSGLVHAGVGKNLAQAAAPRYLDTAAGRVALISVSSTFDAAMIAGKPAARIKGRPGINPLRFEKTVVVNEKHFADLQDIVKATDINAEEENSIRAGYSLPLPENLMNFGGVHIEKGEKEGIKTRVNQTDMQRVKEAIREARFQADYVMVSVHSHEQQGDPAQPTDFLVEFAHGCVDAGADAVIGHGTHQLRPIEVYRSRPIFYSLGDFILELYSVELAPEDFFSKYGLTSHDNTVYDLLKKRSHDFKIGLMAQKIMNQTVIANWEIDGGKLTSLELTPIQVTMEGKKSEIGLPHIATDDEIFRMLKRLSADYGVEMTLQNGTIVCKW